MNKKIQALWLSRNLVGFSLASLMSDCNHEMVPLLLPALVIQLTGSYAAPHYLGIISGFSTAAASITTLFSGWLSDRLTNRKPLLIIGYALTGSLIGLLAFAQQWPQLLLITTIAWIGRGLVSAPRNAIIADSVDPRYYGHAFGFRQAFDTLGAVLGPAIIFFLAGWPPQSLFLIALIPGSIALLAILFFIQEAPQRHKTVDQPNHRAKPTVLSGIILLPLAFYQFLGIMFIFGCGNFNRTLLLLYMRELLIPTSSQAAAVSLITLLYIFRNVTQTASTYLVGALSDRIGRKVPLALFGFLFFGLMCLMLIWPSSSLLYLIALFFLSGASAGSYTTLEKSYAADLLPAHQRGTGYGLLLTITSIGELISSLIVGFLWTAFSPQIGFAYAAVLSLLAAALLFTIPRR